MFLKRIAIISLCIGLLCGCDNANDETPPTSEPAPAPAQTDSVDTHNNVAMKANQWLDIINNDSPAYQYDKSSEEDVELPTVIGQQLVWAKESYVKTVKAQRLFRRKEPVTESEFDMLMSQFKVISSPEERETYRRIGKTISATQPPLPQLDRAGQTLIESEITLSEAVNALVEYHTSGAYRQDRLSKAPALHMALNQAWEQYRQASREANTLRNTLFSEEHDIELAYYKDCGLTGRLAVVESADTVQKIVDRIYTVISQQKKVEHIPLAAWQQDIEQLEDELALIKSLAKDPRTLSDNGLEEAYIKDYAKALDAFIIHLKLTLQGVGESVEKNITLLDELEQKQMALFGVYNQLITGVTCEK